VAAGAGVRLVGEVRIPPVGVHLWRERTGDGHKDGGAAL
jgi:hypothetical protein